MARISNAILSDSAFARGHTQPMLDLTYGGQFGFAPDLKEWVSNQNYVRRNMFCLLVEAPRFFRYLPNPEKWIQVLRSLVELHPRTIEGMNAGLTVEVADTPVGGGGEVQHEYVDVKRAQSTPTFTYDEKYGMPIQTFFRDWITHGLMDPDSKFANVGTLPGDRPSDMLADQYGMTCIFIEPDPTHRKVVKSWLTTNMFPKGTGDITGKRDLASPSELLSITQEFTGLSQFGLGIDVLSQRLLDNININNANPYLRPAFLDGVAPDVEAQNNGYRLQAQRLGETSLARP